MSVLNPESELRYIINWFNEWTDYEKEDFLPVFISYLMRDEGVYMNGVLSDLVQNSINDKPLSLFQCRIKLFKEWSPKWPSSMKQKLTEKLTEIDEAYGERVQSELSTALSVESVGSLGASTIDDVFPTPEVEDEVEELALLVDLASIEGAGPQLVDVNSN